MSRAGHARLWFVREWAPCFLQWGGLGISFAFQGHRAVLVPLTALMALSVLSPWSAVLALPGTLGLSYTLLLVPLSGRTVHISPPELVVLAALFGSVCRISWRGAREGYWRQPWCHTAVLLRWWTARPLSAPAFGLLVLSCASLATVADPTHRHESLRELRWVIVEPLVYYAIAGWYARSQRRFQQLLVSWVLGACVSAGISLTRGIVGAGVAVEGVLRVSGLHPHPNALALYLERPLMLAAALALFTPSSPRRYLWFAASIFLGVPLFLTFSRGAYLGIMAGGLVLAWRHSRRAFAVTLGGAATLVLAAVVAAPQRMASLLGGGSGSMRLAIWHAALAMIRDYPLFGVGLDQFLYQYVPRYVQPAAWAERFTAHPHNLVLDLWLRLGLAGIALAGAVVVLLVRHAGLAWARREPLVIAPLGALIAGLVHGMVDQGYFLLDLALGTWILLTVVEGAAGVSTMTPGEGQQCEF